VIVNRRLSVLLFLLWVPTLTACVCHEVCKAEYAPANKFSGLSEENVSLLRNRETDFAPDFATHEQVIIDGCCSLFATTLAGRHCTPKINAYCDETSPDTAKRERCKTGPCRENLLDRCLRDVYEEFKKYAPTCNKMGLGVNASDTTWTYSKNVVARCPATGPIPLH